MSDANISLYIKITVLLTFSAFLLSLSAVNAQQKHNAAENEVYVTSDNIYNKTIDNILVYNIVERLSELGVRAVNYGIGPNKHIKILQDKNVAQNSLIVDIYGGACAGTIYEMGTKWYKQLKGDRKVFTVFWASTSTDISGLKWLPRAHDDNFSPHKFKGLSQPEIYLHKKGYNYIYSNNINEIVSTITANLNNEKSKYLPKSSEKDRKERNVGLWEDFKKEKTQLQVDFKEKMVRVPKESKKEKHILLKEFKIEKKKLLKKFKTSRRRCKLIS